MLLRRELVKLMSEYTRSGSRDRSGSAHSQRLSLDSLEGQDRRNGEDESGLFGQVDWAKNA